MTIKTVGLIFSPKKLKQSRLEDIVDRARCHGLRFVHLDLDRPLEDQLPLDMIVHKVSDIYGKALQGDPDARCKFERFRSFCGSNPTIRVLDPWENAAILLDRKRTHEACVNAARGSSLFRVPETAFLDSIRDPPAIRFPVICKRQTACAVGGSHEMALVPSARWMASLDQCFQPDEPVLFQEFIEHDGVVIKVYVAQDTICVSSRPSFGNTARTIVSFDSQKLPKAFGPAQQENVVLDADVQREKESLVDHGRLRGIADRLRRELGLTFFGFDVLLESGSAAYYVVDVNYFPSFAELPDFQEVFIKVVQRHLALIKNTPTLSS